MLAHQTKPRMSANPCHGKMKFNIGVNIEATNTCAGKVVNLRPEEGLKWWGEEGLSLMVEGAGAQTTRPGAKACTGQYMYHMQGSRQGPLPPPSPPLYPLNSHITVV